VVSLNKIRNCNNPKRRTIKRVYLQSIRRILPRLTLHLLSLLHHLNQILIRNQKIKSKTKNLTEKHRTRKKHQKFKKDHRHLFLRRQILRNNKFQINKKLRNKIPVNQIINKKVPKGEVLKL
jgi:hypothetical protein